MHDLATRSLVLQAIEEQVEQALNCKIKMKVSIWKHEMVGFWIQSDRQFIQHARFLGEVDQVEACFGLFGDSVNLDAR